MHPRERCCGALQRGAWPRCWHAPAIQRLHRSVSAQSALHVRGCHCQNTLVGSLGYRAQKARVPSPVQCHRACTEVSSGFLHRCLPFAKSHLHRSFSLHLPVLVHEQQLAGCCDDCNQLSVRARLNSKNSRVESSHLSKLKFSMHDLSLAITAC